jgi:hypothetical protein
MLHPHTSINQKTHTTDTSPCLKVILFLTLVSGIHRGGLLMENLKRMRQENINDDELNNTDSDLNIPSDISLSFNEFD